MSHAQAPSSPGSTSSDTVADRFHPEYNDPSADVVLGSSDDILFRVHSYHLKASRFVMSSFTFCMSPLSALSLFSSIRFASSWLFFISSSFPACTSALLTFLFVLYAPGPRTTLLAAQSVSQPPNANSSGLIDDCSTFFRDMLCSPLIGDKRKLSSFDKISLGEEVIPVDVEGDTLGTLLRFMTQREVDIDLYGWDGVLDLCDMLGCELVVERILYRLRDMAERFPLKIFIIASRYNDIGLARQAIIHMKSEAHSLHPQCMPLSIAKKIALPYLLALMGVISINNSDIVKRASAGPSSPFVDWTAAAENFYPRPE